MLETLSSLVLYHHCLTASWVESLHLKFLGSPGHFGFSE